jgi:hypothetical protein
MATYLFLRYRLTMLVHVTSHTAPVADLIANCLSFVLPSVVFIFVVIFASLIKYAVLEQILARQQSAGSRVD